MGIIKKYVSYCIRHTIIRRLSWGQCSRVQTEIKNTSPDWKLMPREVYKALEVSTMDSARVRPSIITTVRKVICALGHSPGHSSIEETLKSFSHIPLFLTSGPLSTYIV
jgi:hypothetical protein